MIPSPPQAIVPDLTPAELSRLHESGWSHEALRVRAQVMRILQNWRVSGGIELAELPTPVELKPLARLAQTDTPAAEDAAMLLALLETGRWVTTEMVRPTLG